jgi:hypothetical protein
MSDHEDSLASLGRSEVSPVNHPVGPPIPEVFQTTDDRCHVSSVVGSEKPGRVLDDHPAGLEVGDEPLVLTDESGELVEVSGPGAGETRSVGCSDGGVLAGESSAEDSGSWESGEMRSGDMADVSKQSGSGKVPPQDGLAVGVELDLGDRADAGAGEAHLEAADAGER